MILCWVSMARWCMEHIVFLKCSSASWAAFSWPLLSITPRHWQNPLNVHPLMDRSEPVLALVALSQPPWYPYLQNSCAGWGKLKCTKQIWVPQPQPIPGCDSTTAFIYFQCTPIMQPHPGGCSFLRSFQQLSDSFTLGICIGMHWRNWSQGGWIHGWAGPGKGWSQDLTLRLGSSPSPSPIDPDSGSSDFHQWFCWHRSK